MGYEEETPKPSLMEILRGRLRREYHKYMENSLPDQRLECNEKEVLRLREYNRLIELVTSKIEEEGYLDQEPGLRSDLVRVAGLFPLGTESAALFG